MLIPRTSLKFSELRGKLSERWSLKSDKAADALIDQGLRAGVEMRGTNLWVLIFAIFIASIGLNVNSTAVIIGAMLISPLMGPIMGIGYGAGILDLALIRRSLNNLGIAMLIALTTSTLYFALSPLSTAQSELLARTSPTIWDVLIAWFGGLAGIIGATRQEKSNLIPGVAIATALMPPLCTVGFGLAHGNWEFVWGALYLFTINSVFIAFAAALVTRAFHVQEKNPLDDVSARRVRRYMVTAVLLTGLPSLYLAVQLVQHELFKARAQTFVEQHFKFQRTHLSQITINPPSKTIELTLIGEYIPPEQLAAISHQLPGADLAQAKLNVHQNHPTQIDVTSLKSSLLADLYNRSQTELEAKDRQIAQLRDQLQAQQVDPALFAQIGRELQTLYPGIRTVRLAPAWGWPQARVAVPPTSAPMPPSASHYAAMLELSRPLSRADLARIQDWLGTRLSGATVQVWAVAAR